MRNRITVLLLVMIGVGLVGGIYAGTEKDHKPSLDVQVQQLIETLQAQIIPPVGTPKAEVDEVYGEPKEIREMGPQRIGRRSDYPMHAYQLLDPIGNAEFRACLYVIYRDGKVNYADINHFRVVKNRGAEIRSAEAGREMRWVLSDLLEIYNKYKVTAASWNASAAGR